MSQSPLTTARKWLVFVGSGLIFAACLIVSASYAGLTPLKILRWPGNDTLLVVGFVTITILVGVVVLNLNFIVPTSRPTLPETETPPPIPQAGAEFDRIIQTRLLAPSLSSEDRHRIRKRLQHIALQTIQRTEGVSQQQAEELINQGEWTENATAAAFLGKTAFPRSVRLCNRVSDRLVFQYGIRQTARAIVTDANEEGSE